jgi:hypothetical protein
VRPEKISKAASRRIPMDTVITTQPSSVVDLQSSGVCWASVSAGAVTAAALTLLLVAFGTGIGLSAVSPWSNSGVAGSTFAMGTGIYLVIVGVMASAVGGYLAARLRAKWTGMHTHEVFFRDTAHGLLAWAFATVISATVLGAATTHLVGGAAGGVLAAAPQAAQNATATDIATDQLFRSDTPALAPSGGAGTDPVRSEASRILITSFRGVGDVSGADRSYLARVVAARTGLSQADAEKRVNEVIAETKQAIDDTRRAAASFALWMAAAMLFGAFAASLAAVEGGQLRDGMWNEKRLVPRAI